jgi:hypothetical protein
MTWEDNFLKSSVPALIKYVILIVFTVIGEMVIRNLSSNNPDEFYSPSLLIGTVLVYLIFGMIIGSDDLFSYFVRKFRLEVDMLRLGLGLLSLVVFITIGIVGIFEPGNNFSPSSIFVFFLKGRAFTPLYLTLTGYFIASSFGKSTRLF